MSEEAALAGESAAAFVKAQEEAGKAAAEPEGHAVCLQAENGVRYTVPQTLDIRNMRDTVTVRFRVGDVFKDRYVAVYYDDQLISRRKKKVLAPGEMEQVVLKKESFLPYPDVKKITIRTEVE